MKRFFIVAVLLLSLSSLFVSCGGSSLPPIRQASDNFYAYTFSFNPDGTGEYTFRIKGTDYDEPLANGTYPLSWKYSRSGKYYTVILSRGIELGGRSTSYLYISPDNYVYFSVIDMDNKSTWNGYKIP